MLVKMQNRENLRESSSLGYSATPLDPFQKIAKNDGVPSMNTSSHHTIQDFYRSCKFKLSANREPAPSSPRHRVDRHVDL